VTGAYYNNTPIGTSTALETADILFVAPDGTVTLAFDGQETGGEGTGTTAGMMRLQVVDSTFMTAPAGGT